MGRGAWVTAASIVVLLLLPNAAGAANVAPNPSFEAKCGNVPCQWTGLGFQGSATTLLYDTNNPHTGSASIGIGASGMFGSIVSDCLPVTPGPSTFSFWYRTSDADVASLQYIPNFWSDANCSDVAGASDSIFVVPLRDGMWHFSGTQTMTVPSGPQAMSLVLSVACGSCPQAGVTAEANLDDVTFDNGVPTAVAIATLTAVRGREGVVITWQGGSDAGTLGFNVYRGGTRLNAALVPARGRVAGGAHRYVDRHAPRHRAIAYRLEVVFADGSSRWFGPAAVSRG